jgi:hypothetical protein
MLVLGGIGRASHANCYDNEETDACARNNMGSKDRKAYITAVKCMFSSPSKSDPAMIPGAKVRLKSTNAFDMKQPLTRYSKQNRYDDFVAQHINQTLSIHGTGNFLTWHRYFTYGYEKALREECGYKVSKHSRSTGKTCTNVVHQLSGLPTVLELVHVPG